VIRQAADTQDRQLWNGQNGRRHLISGEATIERNAVMHGLMGDFCFCDVAVSHREAVVARAGGGA
jgi:hypothetical protein